MAKKVSDNLKRFRSAERKRIAKKEEEKEEPLTKYTSLITQVETEYNLSWQYMKPKQDEWALRLKLYSNQSRDKDRVGLPDLFTIMQTLLANLYRDVLDVLFGGREGGDEDAAENLNSLAQHDYEEMGKAQVDYDWDWDTLFFGRGLKLYNDFDRETKTPVQTTIDPLIFLRDPRATSVNGDKNGGNGMRFGGYPIRLTKAEMKSNPEYFNLSLLRKSGETDPLSTLSQARQKRREQQGYQNMSTWENSLTENYEYEILRWFTHITDDEGTHKYLIEVANDRRLIVRFQKIEWEKWPIIDRACYPMSHDWDGVSVPDIIEGTQRFRSQILNVYGDSAKAATYPMFLYNKDKISKGTDLNPGFYKWIGINGDVNAAVQAIQRSSPDAQVSFILNFLDQSSKAAVASPDQQIGKSGQKPGGKKTKGEIDQLMARIDARYSLTQKIWGWSEAQEWLQWYRIYEKYFENGLDKKTIRIVGPFGPAYKDFRREDIICQNSFGPAISIESKQVSEAKKARQYMQIKDFVQMISSLGPRGDIIYAMRKLGRIFYSKAEVERFLPLDIDEQMALEENKLLSENKHADVRVSDNHDVHLRMHAYAEETEELTAHITAHKLAKMMQKVSPGSFPGQPQEGQGDKGQTSEPSRLASPAPEGATGGQPKTSEPS